MIVVGLPLLAIAANVLFAFVTEPYRGPLYSRGIDVSLRAVSPWLFDALWSARIGVGFLPWCVLGRRFLPLLEFVVGLPLGGLFVRETTRWLRRHPACRALGDLLAPALAMDDAELWSLLRVEDIMRASTEEPLPRVRLGCYRALDRRVQDPHARGRFLTQALRDSSPVIRLFAAMRVADGERSAALSDLVRCSDDEVAAEAVVLLSRTPGRGAEESLLGRLDGARPRVKLALVDALARVGTPVSVDPLRRLSTGPSLVSDIQLAFAVRRAVEAIRGRLENGAAEGQLSLSAEDSGRLSIVRDAGALSLSTRRV